MAALQTLGLFVLTALAEIIGCYLPYLWLRKGHSIWLLAPAALSLALFAWLLTLHPTASDGVRPSASDWIGVGLCIAGMLVIMFGPRGS